MSRETTCAGQGCGDCTVCRLRAEVATLTGEVERLRAKVDSQWRDFAEAGKDTDAFAARERKRLTDEASALRSRLSTVERERDEALEVMAKWEREAEDTLSRLAAVIAERDAIREKAQGDIAGLRGGLKSQARHLADRTRERDEARGLLERALDVFPVWQAGEERLKVATAIRAYLSRSPVEGGREMVTPSVGQRWEVIGDDVDPCDRFVLTGLDADGDWTTLDDDGHEGSATVREFNRGDVYRYIGAAAPETRDMKTREGT